MTYEELLKACSTGALPRVSIGTMVAHATSKKGVVTSVKDTTTVKNLSITYKGCSVRFDGMAYDTWFYAESEKDKRKHYMSELTLLKDKK